MLPADLNFKGWVDFLPCDAIFLSFRILSGFPFLHLIVASGGTDYVTDLGIALAVNTTYHLKISIDSDRKVSAYVNGAQYGVASTVVAAGTSAVNATDKSVALADDKNLIPYIGIQEVGGSGAARSLRVHNQKISRVLFE